MYLKQITTLVIAFLVNLFLVGVAFYFYPDVKKPISIPIYNELKWTDIQCRGDDNSKNTFLIPASSSDTIFIPSDSDKISITVVNPNPSPDTVVVVFENFGFVEQVVSPKGEYDSLKDIPQRMEFYRTRSNHHTNQVFVLNQVESSGNFFKITSIQSDKDLHPMLRIVKLSMLQNEYHKCVFRERSDNSIFMIFIGIFLLQSIYAFLLALANRGLEFWYYLAWTLSVLLLVNIYFGMQTGLLGILAIFPNLKFLDIHTLAFPLTTWLYFGFALNFMQVDRHLPKIARIIKICMAFLLISFISMLVMNRMFPSVERNFFYTAINMCIIYLFSIYMLIVFIYSKVPFKLFIVLGASFIIIGALSFFIVALFVPIDTPDYSFRTEIFRLVMIMGDFICLNAGLLYKIRLERDELQKHREVERHRIAQDLHDDVGTEMSSISLTSFSAARSSDPEWMQEALQTIARQSGQLVHDIGDIVWSIHPNNDTIEKIAVRMRQFAARMLEEQGVAVYFQVAPNALPLKMEPEARKHLYLFFKEAIHNIARHAHCTRADIAIRRENGVFVLEISDNGQGFDPEAPLQTTGGNGLRNLRNRGEVLGGKLVVESAPGGGTVVRLVAPLV